MDSIHTVVVMVHVLHMYNVYRSKYSLFFRKLYHMAAVFVSVPKLIDT